MLLLYSIPTLLHPLLYLRSCYARFFSFCYEQFTRIRGAVLRPREGGLILYSRFFPIAYLSVACVPVSYCGIIHTIIPFYFFAILKIPVVFSVFAVFFVFNLSEPHQKETEGNLFHTPIINSPGKSLSSFFLS